MRRPPTRGPRGALRQFERLDRALRARARRRPEREASALRDRLLDAAPGPSHRLARTAASSAAATSLRLDRRAPAHADASARRAGRDRSLRERPAGRRASPALLGLAAREADARGLRGRGAASPPPIEGAWPYAPVLEALGRPLPAAPGAARRARRRLPQRDRARACPGGDLQWSGERRPPAAVRRRRRAAAPGRRDHGRAARRRRRRTRPTRPACGCCTTWPAAPSPSAGGADRRLTARLAAERSRQVRASLLGRGAAASALDLAAADRRRRRGAGPHARTRRRRGLVAHRARRRPAGSPFAVVELARRAVTARAGRRWSRPSHWPPPPGTRRARSGGSPCSARRSTPTSSSRCRRLGEDEAYAALDAASAAGVIEHTGSRLPVPARAGPGRAARPTSPPAPARRMHRDAAARAGGARGVAGPDRPPPRRRPATRSRAVPCMLPRQPSRGGARRLPGRARPRRPGPAHAATGADRPRCSRCAPTCCWRSATPAPSPRTGRRSQRRRPATRAPAAAGPARPGRGDRRRPGHRRRRAGRPRARRRTPPTATILLARGSLAFFTGDIDGRVGRRRRGPAPRARRRRRRWQLLDLVGPAGTARPHAGRVVRAAAARAAPHPGNPELAVAVFDAHLCVAEYLLYGPPPYDEVIELAADLRDSAERPARCARSRSRPPSGGGRPAHRRPRRAPSGSSRRRPTCTTTSARRRRGPLPAAAGRGPPRPGRPRRRADAAAPGAAAGPVVADRAAPDAAHLRHHDRRRGHAEAARAAVDRAEATLGPDDHCASARSCSPSRPRSPAPTSATSGPRGPPADRRAVRRALGGHRVAGRAAGDPGAPRPRPGRPRGSRRLLEQAAECFETAGQPLDARSGAVPRRRRPPKPQGGDRVPRRPIRLPPAFRAGRVGRPEGRSPEAAVPSVASTDRRGRGGSRAARSDGSRTGDDPGRLGPSRRRGLPVGRADGQGPGRRAAGRRGHRHRR